jgi:hypothetical protein
MKHKAKEHQQDDQAITEDTFMEEYTDKVNFKVDDQDNNLINTGIICHKALLEYVSSQGYPLCEKLTVDNVLVFIQELV